MEHKSNNSATLLVTAGCVLAIAVANGGYNPALWGWITLVALTGTTAALVGADRHRPTLSRPQARWLGGLAAFVIFTLLSAIWTADLTATALASEQMLLYLAVTAAVVLTVTAARAAAAIRGLTGGMMLVCGYALATRLASGHLPAPGGGVASSYKLVGTFGYWNALGIFAAMGTLLAFGLAARALAVGERALWAGCLPLFAATMYFTFSRGAEACLALGFVVMMVADPRRVGAAAVAAGCAPGIALAVVAASRSHALNDAASTLTERSHGGAALLPMLAGGVCLAAVGANVGWAAQRWVRLTVPPGWVAAVVMVAAIGAASVHCGSPLIVARHALHAFAGAPDRGTSDLRVHLTDPSSDNRTAFWSGALDEFRARPIVGAGAGGFERFWLRHRGDAPPGRNANSLYLETLAELGLVGGALLAFALAIPVMSGIRIRKAPLGPALLGCYAVFLLHAAIDWDWQVPAVTLTALYLGCLMVASDGRPTTRAIGGRVRLAGLAVATCLALVAVIGAVGNGDVAAASQALAAGQPRLAERDATAAKAWMPWSDEPWGWQAESQLAQGDLRRARAGFRQAIARDSGNWEDWFGLARASAGDDRLAALAHACRLNPGAPEISQFCRRYRIPTCK
jgi:O-antigen ligase